MLSVIMRVLLVALLAVQAAGCRLIEGVFKAGFGIGVGITLAVVVLLVIIWAMLRSGGGSATT